MVFMENIPRFQAKNNRQSGSRVIGCRFPVSGRGEALPVIRSVCPAGAAFAFVTNRVRVPAFAVIPRQRSNCPTRPTGPTTLVFQSAVRMRDSAISSFISHHSSFIIRRPLRGTNDNLSASNCPRRQPETSNRKPLTNAKARSPGARRRIPPPRLRRGRGARDRS